MKLDALKVLRSFVLQQDTKKLAARKLGISPQYLNDILKENRPIPDDVLQTLGFERVTEVRPK